MVSTATQPPPSADERRRRLTRVLWLSVAAAVCTIALKAGAFVLTGSVGLLSDAAESVQLVVADDGPGLPEDAHVRGRSDRGSSGLGLDIARRCAEASGGSLTLGSTPSGGAQVTLALGRFTSTEAT